MISVLCTSSDDPLYLYKVSWKYLKGFLSYCADTKSWQTDRRTDKVITIGSADFVWRGPNNKSNTFAVSLFCVSADEVLSIL